MADKGKITIRKYLEGDENEIIDLLEYVFDGWPPVDLPCSKLEHWKWKYEERSIKGLIAAVALDEDKIIGCLHSPSVNIKVRENVFFCEPGGDLAVHPDYRGRGIWRSMVNTWTQDKWTPNIIGYNISSTPVVVKRVKARKSLMFPSPVRNYIRIRDIDEFFKVRDIPNSMVKKMGYLGLSSLAQIRNLGKRKIYENFSINTITEFDDRINDLWKQVKVGYDLIVERKKEYLNWRYCDPRGGLYTVRLVEEENEILGYSVLRINRYNPDYPEGIIVDLIVENNDEDVAASLFYDACRFFDNNDVNAARYLAPRDHFISKIIGRFGFLDSQREQVVWFGDNGDPKILETIKNSSKDKVMFQYGDTDGI